MENWSESSWSDLGNSHDDCVELSGQTSLPQALPIVVVNEEEHTFELNQDSLTRVLLDDRVVDLNVVVISVAGAFRKGKSFLLNFLLRYLTHQEQLSMADNLDNQQSSSSHWLGDDRSPLSGFSWRGGCERDTSGIMLWSRPFITRLPSGENIAIILMDTQGAFDSQSTVKDCATVFALSTMISSVQIYNLSQNIQEDDLQHLQLFTEYGRLALENSDVEPFQNLLFLVRDWSYPYEASYGFQGGAEILDRRLKISDKQHPELQQLREHIKSCFANIDCFLMPHPGLKVAINPNFDGRLCEIESDFKENLLELIPSLLSSKNLILKRDINGLPITCRSLVEYFKSYVKIFREENLPEPKSMLTATAEANNLAALVSAKAFYVKSMEQVCGGETPYIALSELETAHREYKNRSIDKFLQTKKMGGHEFSKVFMEQLDQEISESYGNFVKSNNSKNVFRSARTPAVLFVVVVGLYLMQEILQLFSLDSIAALFSTTLGFFLLTITVWFYARYTGTAKEIAKVIDDLATGVWENLLKPCSKFMAGQLNPSLVSQGLDNEFVNNATLSMASKALNSN